MNRKSTALVIVFNHRYDGNIEKLERIYRDKFEDIYFLVPFYDGNKENVIPVYESSYSFQGFFTQAYRHIKKEYDYYAFVADDLILNPRINSENLPEILKLKDESSYIKELIPLSNCSFESVHMIPSLNAFNCTPYLHFQEELPSKAEALEAFAKHNISLSRLGWKNLKGYNGKYKYKNCLKSFLYLYNLYNQKKLDLPYPLVMGYSDFVVISSHSMEKFCHLCGIFAAMNLFIETAVPTALALSSEHIVLEKDLDYKGWQVWDLNQVFLKVARKHAYDISSMLASFDENKLYMHPIKLSKWKFKDEKIHCYN